MRLFTVLKFLQIYFICLAIYAVIFIQPLCKQSPLSNEILERLLNAHLLEERGHKMVGWLDALAPEVEFNGSDHLHVEDSPKEDDQNREMMNYPKNSKSAVDLPRMEHIDHGTNHIVNATEVTVLPPKKPDAIVETIAKDLDVTNVTVKSVTENMEIIALNGSVPAAPQFLNASKTELNANIETLKNGSFLIPKTATPLIDVTFVALNKIEGDLIAVYDHENGTTQEPEVEGEAPKVESKIEQNQESLNETNAEEGKILPTDSKSDVLTSTKVPGGFLSWLVGRKKRFSPGLLQKLFGIKGKFENQTVMSIERCEEIDPWSYEGMLFSSGNIFKDVTAKRHYSTLALVIHLLLAVYHLFSNCCTRLPWSHSANRTIAVISLMLWTGVCGWVFHERLVWNSKFTQDATFAGVPFIPLFPKEYNVILVLSLIMFTFLAIEIVDHKALFVSLSLREVEPSMGYVRAAQNENEYIESVIEQLEMSQMSPENPHEPISHAIDLKKTNVERF